MNGHDVTLNLGPFNNCVEYLSDHIIPEYPVDFYTSVPRVAYYSQDTEQVCTDTTENSIIIPMMDFNFTLNNCNESYLIDMFSLKIINMIYSLANEFNLSINIDNIVIPIKHNMIIKLEDNILKLVIKIGIGIFVDDQESEVQNERR
ncbi:MAG: hypothetical protein JSW11_00400 [Candidatus Heimdallarchaeota archaeon]|nr:MAG: hypothetical protein JSW11_00400 [Candidatus Heimdallarchaeota archaeon]